jgi:hypothetical protein
MAEQHVDVQNPDVHHETPDANIRGVLVFAGGLIVAAVFIHFAVWVLFRLLADQNAHRAVPEYPLAATQERRLPPEPRLQPVPPEWRTPREDLRDFRRREDEVLSTYGWADKNAGAVRIPIGEAMKLTVQRGLPARPAAGEQRK